MWPCGLLDPFLRPYRLSVERPNPWDDDLASAKMDVKESLRGSRRMARQLVGSVKSSHTHWRYRLIGADDVIDIGWEASSSGTATQEKSVSTGNLRRPSCPDGEA